MSDNPLRSVSLITHPQKGGCILFAWGPPWNWKPSFQRSRMFAGPFWESEETRFLCSDCEDEQRQAAQKPEV